MLKPFVPIVLCAAALPLPAMAQDKVFPMEVQTGSGKITSIGSGEDTARAMQIEMRTRQLFSENCWNVGCLFIVNDSASYDLVGFYVSMARPGEPQKWGPNQFRFPLRPMQATYRFRTGGPGSCDQPVRWVLRHQKTGEKVQVDGTARLCSAPHEDAIVHVKVQEGRVILEDGHAE